MESVLPNHLTKDNYDFATYDLDNDFQLRVLVEMSDKWKLEIKTRLVDKCRPRTSRWMVIGKYITKQ